MATPHTINAETIIRVRRERVYESEDFYERASCRGIRDVDFHPERNPAFGKDQPYPTKRAQDEMIEKAKAVCSHCPVKGRCLDLAIANNEQQGIWGGLLVRDRRKVVKLRAGRP